MTNRKLHARATLALVVAMALAVFALWGCAGSGGSASPNTVAISVTEDGFEPNNVNVKANQPVTLNVTRKTDRTCATELVLKEYDINQKLPLNETVTITFTPTSTGQLTYACGMDMYKGTITVQ
jgi:plastocyanin domain-containing protein